MSKSTNTDSQMCLLRGNDKKIKATGQLSATRKQKLHHDNAVSHTFVVTEYLVKNGIVTIPQPPYNGSDLASADFFLFSVFKTT